MNSKKNSERTAPGAETGSEMGAETDTEKEFQEFLACMCKEYRDLTPDDFLLKRIQAHTQSEYAQTNNTINLHTMVFPFRGMLSYKYVSSIAALLVVGVLSVWLFNQEESLITESEQYAKQEQLASPSLLNVSISPSNYQIPTTTGFSMPKAPSIPTSMNTNNTLNINYRNRDILNQDGQIRTANIPAGMKSSVKPLSS